MNSLGITNISPETNGGFNPASGNLTASERAEINRMSNSNNYYSSGCSNNSMNSNMSMIARPNNNTNGNTHWSNGTNMSTQQNMSRPTTGNGSISFTPETLTNMNFLPAYLSQYIGHWVRADFFIGETIEQRVGVLHEVGASYFILEAIEPQTLLVCDMFSVKFVTIILDDDLSRLARF